MVLTGHWQNTGNKCFLKHMYIEDILIMCVMWMLILCSSVDNFSQSEESKQVRDIIPSK